MSSLDSLRDDVRSLSGPDVQPAGSDPGSHHDSSPFETHRAPSLQSAAGPDTDLHAPIIKRGRGS